MLIAAAAASAVAAGAWWATHPDDLGGVGDQVGISVGVGEPALVGEFAYPSSGSVVLRAAEARVREGSAAADVRVVFCAQPSVGTPIGVILGRAEDVCADIRPIEGQRLEMPSAANEYGHLVVEVVPRESGEIIIDGLKTSYSSGFQRGTETAGAVVRVRATRG